jgi:MFS family permease
MSSAPAQPGPAASPDPYLVLRNPNVFRYLIGRFIANFGQQMFVVALGWEVYERTHSPFALGLVGLTQILPMFLFTLAAGHLADHHSRKRIIIFTASLLALANVGLALISAWQAPVPLIYLCLLVAGSARTFMGAAIASFLPQLVERNLFARAVTWNSGLFQASCILGLSLGGVLINLFGHHAWPIYVINALAALSFCGFLGFIHLRPTVTSREPMTLKNLLTGFSFVFSSRIILGIITLDMFAVLLGGATALLPIYAKEILHVGPQGLGVLQAALPCGSVVCAFYLAHRPPLQKAGRALLWAVVCFGLATIGFGLSQWFWLSLAMLVACGMADNVSVVVRHTLVQTLTPDEKRGRVSAVNNLFIGTSNELGEFESGSVAKLCGPMLGFSNAVGAMISVVAGGVGTMIVVGVVAWLWPEIRRYGRLDQFTN